MIFISLGTQKFSFNRILEYVDKWIKDSSIDEDVIVQSGFTNYSSEKFKIKAFMNPDEYDEYLRICRVFITHGGVGSILNGLKNEKRILVVPRKSELNEHVDNHQIEISRKFDEKGYILVCENYEDFKTKMCKINDFEVKKIGRLNKNVFEEKLISYIDEFF